MTNLKPNLHEYLDILIETANSDVGRNRWRDLKRNLENRIDRGHVYLTPAEAKGIRDNKKFNKYIKPYIIPADLTIMISHALEDKPDTVSVPDPEPVYPHEIEAIAVGQERGTISLDQTRDEFRMAPLDEEDIKKPTAADHSIWDMKVKKSTVSLNEAAADLIFFCREWAQQLRDKK